MPSHSEKRKWRRLRDTQARYATQLACAPTVPDPNARNEIADYLARNPKSPRFELRKPK